MNAQPSAIAEWFAEERDGDRGVGYRFWRSVSPDGLLVSPLWGHSTGSVTWRARCGYYFMHPAPYLWCSCGIVVMSSLAAVAGRMVQYVDWVQRFGNTEVGFPVIGKVTTPLDWLIDDCSRHAFRTGEATLVELWVPAGVVSRQREVLADRYGVPVHVGTRGRRCTVSSLRGWAREIAPDVDPTEHGCTLCRDDTYPLCARCQRRWRAGDLIDPFTRNPPRRASR